jgi:hypothetical protein
MSHDRQQEMSNHLAELRTAHENDAVRQTLFAFVPIRGNRAAYGEKVENYFNWLMAATGAALAFLFTQWSGVTGAIGTRPAVAVAALLLFALLVRLVARFENYQAQTIRTTWAALPAELAKTRAAYGRDVADYLAAMKTLFGAQPRWDFVDLNKERIGAKVTELMPPNFNTGWRAPFWWIMTWVALALTGREKPVDQTGEEFHGTAQAAYRVGSAMWLIVMYQALLIAAAFVAFVGLLLH